MKKNTIIQTSLIITITLLLLSTTVPATHFTTTSTPQQITNTKAWTALFYIDNDYANGGDLLASIFQQEIASNENLNIFVIQDKIDDTGYYYYINETHEKIMLEDLGEVNMANSDTLRDFITYGKTYYPADRYLLWIVNHGGAWKGACMDDTNNAPAMPMDGIQQALAESGGVDIICFLACLMSSLESVYELRDLVDVYIGSEDLAHMSAWRGICADTNELLTNHTIMPSEEIGTHIVNYFKDHNNPPANVLTMSAIRTNKIQALVNAVNDLAKYYVTHWLRSYTTVKHAFDQTYLLSDWQEWAEVFEVYDLRGFLQNLPQCPKTQAALEAFDAAIIHEVHGVDRTETYGLSIFFQAHTSSYNCFRIYKDIETGLDFPQDTWWNEFLFLFILTNIILRN